MAKSNTPPPGKKERSPNQHSISPDKFREFSAAYALYTQAIHLNPTSPTLYSNRSATLLSMNKLPLALNDANQAIKLDPTWSKAYRRKASVLEAQKELDKAKGVFEESLKVALADLKASPEQKKKEEAEIKKLIEGERHKRRNSKPLLTF